MQKDLHYYAVAYLGRAAGLSLEEATTVAYASQYVDDATESEPIRVGDQTFDPVRTAHYFIESYTWGVQRKVFIPFHFLPPKAGHGSLVTEEYQNSQLAKLLYNEACTEKIPPLRLIRLGVALHTIADTYSHQGFSGRKDSENDIRENLITPAQPQTLWQRIKGATLKLGNKLKNFFYDAIPPIGHAQVINNPDLPYLQWGFTYEESGQSVPRDNPAIFLNGCRCLYDLLAQASAHTTLRDWADIEPKVISLLAMTGEEEARCKNWQDEFNKTFNEKLPDYDKYAWRMQALSAGSAAEVMWDRVSREKFQSLRFNRSSGFYNSNWVNFHRAAMLHRFLVLFNLTA